MFHPADVPDGFSPLHTSSISSSVASFTAQTCIATSPTNGLVITTRGNDSFSSFPPLRYSYQMQRVMSTFPYWSRHCDCVMNLICGLFALSHSLISLWIVLPNTFTYIQSSFAFRLQRRSDMHCPVGDSLRDVPQSRLFLARPLPSRHTTPCQIACVAALMERGGMVTGCPTLRRDSKSFCLQIATI